VEPNSADIVLKVIDQATINQIRAFLVEQGITVRAGARALRNSLFEILKNRADEISARMSQLIVGLYEDWLWLWKAGRRRRGCGIL
jgi:ATP-dependent protease HslVU (ClpYQ) peptidase subunit